VAQLACYGVIQRLASSDCHGPPQLRPKQAVERLGQLARDVVVIINVQMPEERKVELSAKRAGRLPIRRLAVAGSRQRLSEIGLGLSEIALDGC
jgi:hypothetical protein